MKISEKIITLRKQHGWSQEMLANELGVSRQTVYKWENDLSKPELEQVKGLTALFKVTYEFLLNDNLGEPNIENQNNVLYRDVFATEKRFSEEIVMREHGYIKQGNRFKMQNKRMKSGYKMGYTSHMTVSDSEQVEFNLYREQMWKYLESKNYSECFVLSPGINFSFFIDEKNSAFGFYFDGCEQFVCPFENFIDVAISDSGYGSKMIRKPVLGVGTDGSFLVGSQSETVMTRPDVYFIAVSYFDKNGNICIYKQSIAAVYEYIFKTGMDLEIYKEIVTPAIKNALHDLVAKLASIKARGELIRHGKVVVAKLNIDAYKQFHARNEVILEKQRQIAKEREEEIKSEQAKLNKNIWRLLGILFVLFAVIMAIVTSTV